MQKKILIVDDETMLTELLAEHLEANGYLPYTANTSERALALLKVRPDLILLDINMPDIDGLRLCRQIRGHVVCPILFLTARITEQDKVTGLQSGGDDYITKPFSLKELTARIEAHLRRDQRGRAASDLISSQGLIVNLSARSVCFGDAEISFSKREFDIIEFLLSNANQVFDKERIYEAVWGYDAEGDSNVVKEHVRKIRTKLQAAAGRDYIETIWGMGYKWKS
ncbi:response regulator transcription factor [Candidatus Soleaferrea massiliensis]|uniref:response regulator transcription factor n=1 Tax=Candidatus Soleaferrea massiliensis TaxID=1470354 RepID=UPI00058ADF4F|nr:response regulator transcription factor [Candidatus Soleaferrea massiliensis]